MAVSSPAIGQSQELPPPPLHSHKDGCEHVFSASFEDLLPLLEVSNPSDVPLALAATRRLAELASNDPSAPFIMLSKQPDLYKTLSRLALSGVTDLFLASMDALVELDVALSCGGEPGGSFLSFYSSSPASYINQILIKYPNDFSSSRLMGYEHLDNVFLKVLNGRMSINSPFAKHNASSSLFLLLVKKPYLAVKVVSWSHWMEVSHFFKEISSKHMTSKGVSFLSLKLAEEALHKASRMISLSAWQEWERELWLSLAVMSDEDWEYIRGLNNLDHQSRALLEKSLMPFLKQVAKEYETSGGHKFALESISALSTYLEMSGTDIHTLSMYED